MSVPRPSIVSNSFPTLLFHPILSIGMCYITYIYPIAYHQTLTNWIYISFVLRLNLRKLYNLCYVYFADHCRVDVCLAFTFCTSSDATRVVYGHFAVIAQRLKNISTYYYSRMLFFLLFVCSSFSLQE